MKDKTQTLTDALIKSEIMGAARDTVDPEAIHGLLAPKATVSDAGIVTIDGKTPADAVAEVLKVKKHFNKNASEADNQQNTADSAYQTAKDKKDVMGMLKAKSQGAGSKKATA